MSHAHHDDIADIRRELWSLYAGLKEGEVDAEVGETMISALDSLVDSIRLERELRGAAGKEDAREQPLNAL